MAAMIPLTVHSSSISSLFSSIHLLAPPSISQIFAYSSLRHARACELRDFRRLALFSEALLVVFRLRYYRYRLLVSLKLDCSEPRAFTAYSPPTAFRVSDIYEHYLFLWGAFLRAVGVSFPHIGRIVLIVSRRAPSARARSALNGDRQGWQLGEGSGVFSLIPSAAAWPQRRFHPDRFVTRRTRTSMFWDFYVGAMKNVRIARDDIPQDAQKGRPARPQASQNRRRTLWGTLRISVSRERRWRTFSASCWRVVSA